MSRDCCGDYALVTLLSLSTFAFHHRRFNSDRY